MSFPNFFIVGAPKAGTTSVYRYLAEHPQVFLSPVKEPNHFASRSIREQGLYYDAPMISRAEEYAALFEGSEGFRAIGEASVSYMFYEEACERIASACPGAKILVFLRDPAERAFSHYLMDARLGLVDRPLEGVLDAAGCGDAAIDLRYQQYVKLGLYSGQLARYLEAFGPERVLVTFFEDVSRDALAASRRIFAFLGVDEEFSPETQVAHNPYRRPRGRLVGALYRSQRLRSLARAVLPARGLSRLRESVMPSTGRPRLEPSLRARLVDVFRDDVERLEVMCGRDLESWRRG